MLELESARGLWDEAYRVGVSNTMRDRIRRAAPGIRRVRVAADGPEWRAAGFAGAGILGFPEDQAEAAEAVLGRMLPMLAGAPIPGADADGWLGVCDPAPEPVVPDAVARAVRDRLDAQLGERAPRADVVEAARRMESALDFGLDPETVGRLAVQHGTIRQAAGAVAGTRAWARLGDRLADACFQPVSDALEAAMDELDGAGR